MKVELLGLSVFSSILIAVFILFIVQYFTLLKKVNINFRWLLFSCRLITIILLIILVLDPWINWRNIKYSKPNLNIYLDNSRSIALADSSINLSAKIDFIDSWARERDVKTNWYLFGDSLRDFNYKQKLFIDSYSSLEGVEKHIVLDQGSNHLIITDGHINKGISLDNIMINNSNIYISGVGSRFDNTDCYISSIQTDNESQNNLDLIVTVGCMLSKQKSINLSCILLDDKGVVRKDEMILDFNQSGFQDISLLNIEKNDLSVFNSIQIKTDLEELTYRNNNKNFIINKSQENDKILLLTGGLSANTKFIKKVIRNKFPNLELHHYFHDKQIDYESLNEYSMIILDNFPFSNKNLVAYNTIVDSYSQIPIIYFQGPGLSLQVAENIAKKIDLNLIFSEEENLDVHLINNHFLFNEIDFNKIPPTNKNMFWISGKLSNDPITYFDNQSIAAMQGKKKTAVFISNLANSNLIESNLFNSNNVIEYTYNIILNEYRPESELISLNIDSEEYTIGADIDACINIDEKIINSDFYMNIYDLEDKLYNQIMLGNKVSNDCNYSFNIDDLGKYYIQVASEDKNSTFLSNKQFLVINDFDIELEFLYQNKKSIHNFKTKHNAVYFDFADLEQSLGRIALDEVIVVRQSTLNSLSTQYFWIFFIILLALEWYLRKKNKLL